MKTRQHIAAAWLCLVALSPVCLTGCGGPAQGFESPEACCVQLKGAIEKKDMGGVYDCLTEESHNILAGGMATMKFMSAMAHGMGGPDAAKEFVEIDAVLAKHGVTDEAFQKASPDLSKMQSPEEVKKLADIVPDKRAFVVDMFAAMEKSGKGADLSQKFDGEIKEMKIEGDQATATLKTASGEEELDFRKTPSGWKLHIDMEKLAAKSGPPAGAGMPTIEPPAMPPLPAGAAAPGGEEKRY